MLDFLKKNIILVAAWALAAASAFVVHPSLEYVDYIDVRSLLILWSLMLIMRGYLEAGFFDAVAVKLLSVTGTYRQIAIALVSLCFFSSMLITNDVALITFVPFTLFVLPRRNVRRYIIPVLVLETIAANLGSMLTPIGNPQNLYLFNLAKMSGGEFISLMLPLSAVSYAGLLACTMVMVESRESIVKENDREMNSRDKLNTLVYTVLFALAILTVVKVVDVKILSLAVLATFLVVNFRAIGRVDYGLLLTFVGFFIFTGNMARLPAISSLLESVVGGHELAMGICLSQVISNVPAALMLSDFTTNYQALIEGVNIGGLGTLIASMASLITFKLFEDDYSYAKGVYLRKFTALNIVFLAALVGVAVLI